MSNKESELLDAIKELYEFEPVGGALHIVLDDEDIGGNNFYVTIRRKPRWTLLPTSARAIKKSKIVAKLLYFSR